MDLGGQPLVRHHIDLLVVALSVGLAACSKSAGKDDAATASSATSSSLSTGASEGQTIVTGTLVVETDGANGNVSRSPAGGATVYLEGHEGSPALAATAGTFAVAIPPEVFAADDGAALVGDGTVTWGASYRMNDGSYRAIRQVGVALQRGRENTLGEVVLKLAVTVTGLLELDGAADHSGTTFMLPGTPFKALTDAAGRYTLYGVPAGEWPGAKAIHELYATVQLEPWVGEEGQTFSMPTVTMEQKD